MKNRHPIDQVYNQRFESFEPSFDQQEVWRNLEGKLEAKDGGRSWPLFSLLALALIVSLAFKADSLLGKHVPQKLMEEEILPGQEEQPGTFTALAERREGEMEKKEDKGAQAMVEADKLKAKVLETKALPDQSAMVRKDIYATAQAETVLPVWAKESFEKEEVEEHMVATVTAPVLLLPGRLKTLPARAFAEFQLDLPKRKRDWSRDCAVQESPSFYLNPYVGGLYTFQGLNPLSDQENFAAQWAEYDDALPGYAVGLMLGYEHSSGLNLEAGLEWQQVFERLLFYQLVTETIKVYSDSAYYWEDENGNIEYFGDTVTTERTYERKVQSLKRHRIWSIPFGAGYTFGKGKWQMGLQLGAVFHLDHQFKGRVFTQSGSFEYLDPVQDKGYIYEPKLGLTWFGSLRFYFLPSQRMEWYVAPGFRYNRNSWTTAESGLELLNQFGELKLGARIFF
jgi:hypothetical protein